MNNVIKMPGTKQFKFGNLDLQLKLEGNDVLNIEKRIKKSMYKLFIDLKDGSGDIPETREMLIILQEMNKSSGVSDAKMLEAFNVYFSEGNAPMELMSVIQEVIGQSGFFGKEEVETDGESKVVSLDQEETTDEEPTL